MNLCFVMAIYFKTEIRKASACSERYQIVIESGILKKLIFSLKNKRL